MIYSFEIEEELGWVTKTSSELPYKIEEEVKDLIYVLHYSFQGIQLQARCVKQKNSFIWTITPGEMESKDEDALKNFIRKEKLKKLLQ